MFIFHQTTSLDPASVCSERVSAGHQPWLAPAPLRSQLKIDANQFDVAGPRLGAAPSASSKFTAFQPLSPITPPWLDTSPGITTPGLVGRRSSYVQSVLLDPTKNFMVSICREITQKSAKKTWPRSNFWAEKPHWFSWSVCIQTKTGPPCLMLDTWLMPRSNEAISVPRILFNFEGFCTFLRKSVPQHPAAPAAAPPPAIKVYSPH